MKIKFDLKKNEDFAEALRVMSSTIPEYKVFVKEDKLVFAGMCGSNISMVFIEVDTKSLLEFESGEDFVIDGVEFLKELSTYKKGEVTIEVKDDLMYLTHISDKDSSNIGVPIDDMYGKESELPDLKYEGMVVVNTARMMDVLTPFKTVEALKRIDAMDLHAGKDTMNLVVGKKTTDMQISHTLKECSARYAIKPIWENLSKKIAEEIELQFAKDYPLTVTYRTPSLKYVFIIAPRVDND